MGFEYPELIKVVNNVQSTVSADAVTDTDYDCVIVVTSSSDQHMLSLNS